MLLTIPSQLSGPPMPKNILIDLNIILDVLLARSGYEASSAVLQFAESGTHKLYISAHIVSTFAYLLENAKVPRQQILTHIEWLLQSFDTVAIDKALLASAIRSHITDYEDALVEQAALASGCEVIITRNIKDFRRSRVRAITPENFLPPAA